MGTITDNEVKEVSKLIEENTVEEDKKVVQFPSNNGVLENESNDLEPETKQVKASINVNTGAIDTLLNDDDSELQIDPELMKLLTMEDDDVYKVPENVSDIKVSDDELKKSAESLGFGEEDIIAIMPLLKKYMDAQVFCCHFIFQIRFGIRFPARNPRRNRISAGNFLFCFAIILIASPCTSLLVLHGKYACLTAKFYIVKILHLYQIIS